MRALTANALLGAWERALSESPTQRALTLLALACAETPPEQLTALTIGQRDAHLLDLREAAFGSQMSAHATCPACSRELELHFAVSSIRAASPPSGATPYMLAWNEHQVEFRLPNSEDVAAVAPTESRAANTRRLLERCVLSARRKGEVVSVDSLPAELLMTVSERMGDADPQAAVQLALTCPDCSHSWQSRLDIVSYLWAEIHAWATRLLRDIHTLASAYGWREADILALNPWRRQAYLEMIHR